jgi:translation elongation factor EF-Ts
MQFNSETDFVARNEQFQRLSNQLVSTALAALPHTTAGVATGHTTGLRASTAEELAALRAQPLLVDGGKYASAGALTVEASIAGLVGVIRENLVLRR